MSEFEILHQLSVINKKTDHILKQNADILEMMKKFIDRMEEIESIMISTNKMKN